MIRFYEIIKKKREGNALSTEEIEFFIRGCTDGSIPDYQASALLMAIFFRGMDERETADLTIAMVNSGHKIDLGLPKAVDKHSTGGVGDTTTLIVAPIVAACNVPVAKMTGRGLGHTGGTVDKLESITGFSTSMAIDLFKKQVAKTGLAIISASSEIAPADKVLYALRDVTATVESVPLIASSIMSKKLASGATHIVLDVKFGKGAFMTEYRDAERLAQTMIDIGNRLNRPTTALLTSMDVPLGNSIGNALEIQEALSVLAGTGGSQDLRDVSLALAREMILHYYPELSVPEAFEMASEALNSGRALSKFHEMVESQGGDLSQGLPKAKHRQPILSNRSGYVVGIDPLLLGNLAVEIGAGRHKKGDQIDYAAGFTLNVRVGSVVESGSTLLVAHTNSLLSQSFIEQLSAAFFIADSPPLEYALFVERMT